MKKHIFENICLDFDPILSVPKFSRMVKEAIRQSKIQEAIKRTDFANYKDYEEGDWSPMYYGLFTEWFAQAFLNYFGHIWNIGQVEMLAVEGSSEDDLGTDACGISLANKKHGTVKTIQAKAGSPVAIQVKGALNPKKIYTANDGARLPNFFMHAMSTAIRNKSAYQSRYIVFITGDSLHYKLEQMSGGIAEVINYRKIAKLVDNNPVFLNVLRNQVGLKTIDVQTPSGDPEAVYNELHYAD